MRGAAAVIVQPRQILRRPPATKIDNPKYERNLTKTDETSFTMRDRSENDPTMIRE